jgi:hypothetical protein
VVTTRTEDGHRKNTITSTAIQTERKKKHRKTEEEMEGLTLSGGLRKRLTRLNLHEHDDDDDDDDDDQLIHFSTSYNSCGTTHCLLTPILSLCAGRHVNKM